MASKKLSITLLALFLVPFLSHHNGVEGSHLSAPHHDDEQHEPRRSVEDSKMWWNYRPKKIFVFGDSYADTGNSKLTEECWTIPYGMSFPGHPFGRYSDGHVLTDLITKYLEVKPPVVYKWRKLGFPSAFYGMNFAYGGTGVFDTDVKAPNMTTQIDLLERLIKRRVYSQADLDSSVAILTNSGNDFSYVAPSINSTDEWFGFSNKVNDQLTANMRRIHDLGVKKVVLAGLQPLGCLPRMTSSTNFSRCNERQNQLVRSHNLDRGFATEDLNAHYNSTDSFYFLNIYDPFMNIIVNGTGENTLDCALPFTKFSNPLKPCCYGVTDDHYCGDVDTKTGEKKYTLCKNPSEYFFWDRVHPTQAGWASLFCYLEPTLRKLR